MDQLIDLLEQHVADGTELGASICVIRDGEVVVDVWGGWKDAARTVPWAEDTIAPVWSITKTMANLTALVAADRGLIELTAPVATYWPEFAENGKESVTVAHLLSHSSGISGWDQPVSADDLFDWDKSTRMLAAQAPWWPPGSAPGYHLVSQGHLVGEVVRRATGQTLGQWFAQEIAGPLGADFHIGLDPAHDSRVAELTPPKMIDTDTSGFTEGSVTFRSFTGPFLHASEANSERWRRAEIPAANGIGNARSIAKVQALMSHGGTVNGVSLLSEATIEQAMTEQVSGIDVVLNLPSRFAMGWGLPQPEVMPSVPEGRRCYWGGLGGSVVLNDLERRTTVAYAMNRMIFELAPQHRQVRPVGDSRFDAYLAALSDVLR